MDFFYKLSHKKYEHLPQKKKKIFFLSLISILYILFSGELELYGQGGKTWMGNNLEQQIKEAKLNIGPFRIKPVLYLNNAGYDSNVYRTPVNPIKDFTIAVGPGFYVYLPIKKKIIISLYESPQYVYFAETKRERTWNNYFNGRVHFVLNRFFITLGKGYSIARERWSTEIDIRPQRKEDSSQGLLFWQLSKKTSLSIEFRQAKYDYEELSLEQTSIAESLNRIENRINLSGYYDLSFHTKFFLNFEYGYFDFQFPLNPRDSKSYVIYGGFDLSPFGVMRGRINLGYKYFDFLVPGIKDYSGIVGDTSLSIRVVKALIIRANYRRDVQFSSWSGYSHYLESVIGSGASIYLSSNIRLDYNYYFGSNNYQSTIAGQASLQEREDNYETHSIGLYLRLKNSVGLGIIATLWERNSSFYWANGKQNFIGVNLIHDF